MNSTNQGTERIWRGPNSLPAKFEKMLPGLLSFGLFLNWLALCFRLGRHWNTRPGDCLFVVVLMALLLPSLWVVLLRERVSARCLMVAFGGILCSLTSAFCLL